MRVPWPVMPQLFAQDCEMRTITTQSHHIFCLPEMFLIYACISFILGQVNNGEKALTLSDETICGTKRGFLPAEQMKSERALVGTLKESSEQTSRWDDLTVHTGLQLALKLVSSDSRAFVRSFCISRWWCRATALSPLQKQPGQEHLKVCLSMRACSYCLVMESRFKREFWKLMRIWPLLKVGQ